MKERDAPQDAPEQVRISLALPRALHYAVVEWRHERRLSSLSDAIRTLLQRGLDAQPKEKAR